ncbi:MAG: DUF4625 domain-containing protein [Bernardetiaceae bacterium]
MRRPLYLCCFLCLLGACIPIEDAFNPNINDLDVGDQYALEDTLRVRAILTDNFNLTRAFIEIVQIAGERESPWQISDSLHLQGRRFELEYKAKIPLDAVPGTYEVSVVVVDAGGNESFLRGRFVVRGDIRGPQEIEPIRLLEPADDPFLIVDGRTVVCRQTLLQLEGVIRDNIGIARVRAQLGDLPGITRLVTPSQEEVRLQEVFADGIRIPSNIPNGQTLDLLIEATDTDNNTIRRTIPLLVFCDDVAPLIENLSTSPAFDSLSREVNVIEGGVLTITDLLVSDDLGLDRLWVFFNPIGSTRDTLYNLLLDDAFALNLDDLEAINNGPLVLPLPEVARFGDRYEVVLLARDMSGNLSEPQGLVINVRNDAAPRITITEVLINNRLQESDTTQGTAARPYQIRERERVNLRGKITDDRQLSEIAFVWGGTQVLLLNESDLGNTAVFDLEDARLTSDLFTIPRDTPAGTSYQLTIRARDSRGNTDEQTRFFRVIE